MTSSSLLSFRRIVLRINKPKPPKKKQMRKHKVVTSTQNKWLSVNEQVRLALNKDSVKETSVTQNSPSVPEKVLANIKRLNSGEFEAKRKQALDEYWEAKRAKKAKSKQQKEAHQKYLTDNNLSMLCVHIPKELHLAFKKHCAVNGMFYADATTVALLDYITKK